MGKDPIKKWTTTAPATFLHKPSHRPRTSIHKAREIANSIPHLKRKRQIQSIAELAQTIRKGFKAFDHICVACRTDRFLPSKPSEPTLLQNFLHATLSRNRTPLVFPPNISSSSTTESCLSQIGLQHSLSS